MRTAALCVEHDLWRPRMRFQALCGICALLVGCSGSAGKEGLVPATGTVTLDGEPLVNAQVNFDHPDQPETFGRTDSKGHFEMSFTMSQKGAFVGRNIVSFSTVDTEQVRGKIAQAERIPRQYRTGKSTLTVDVKAGGGPYDFTLTSGGSQK